MTFLPPTSVRDVPTLESSRWCLLVVYLSMEDVALTPVRNGFAESNSKHQHSSDLKQTLLSLSDKRHAEIGCSGVVSQQSACFRSFLLSSPLSLEHGPCPPVQVGLSVHHICILDSRMLEREERGKIWMLLSQCQSGVIRTSKSERSFWCGPFFRVFIEFVIILTLLYWFFGPEAYGILAI